MMLLMAIGAGAQEVTVEPAQATPDGASLPERTAVRTILPDASLDLIIRNYAGGQEIDGGFKRHAWMQSAQARFDTGYTPGLVGVGISVSPFIAARLESSERPGNMVVEQDRRLSAYLGGYTLQFKAGNTVLKYGLQRVSNPFLESKDNRALPPTFRGTSVISTLSPTLTLSAGSFNAVQGRGHPELRDMISAYGGVPIKRLDYLGANWQYSGTGSVAVYSSRSRDLWDQHFVSLAETLGSTRGIQWSTNAELYVTRDQGARLQGAVDNKAYSLGLSAKRDRSTVVVAYQRIVGDEYFDYPNDTWGNYLANSSAEDYNTPHERSVQLRYQFAGDAARAPGFRFKAWFIAGDAPQASEGAARYPAPGGLLYHLYWRDGMISHGYHREIGMLPSYEFQSGPLKKVKVSLLMTVNSNPKHYVNAGSREYNLRVEYPVKVF